MAWYDYLTGKKLFQTVTGTSGWGDALHQVGLNGASEADQAKMDRLNSVGSQGMGFAGDARANYNNMTQRLGGSLDYLQGQMQGRNSVAAEQLRQGQQANLAQQQSFAAGAMPGNAAMAARTAANNMGRLGYGLAGQQALAGIAERNAAAQQYASLLGQARGQDLQGTLGGYGVGVSAYGGGLNGQRDPTFADQFLLPALNGAMSIAGK